MDSNDPVCNNISILHDDITEGCEAFLIDIEVQAAFSGIAVVPNDVDKMIILIEDDLMEGNGNEFMSYGLGLIWIGVDLAIIFQP